jgi:putative transposase
MGRNRRDQLQPCAYHITHRCHGRSFLLKFAKDRRAYLERLRQAVNRYAVDVLSYMVTANHVHLLLWAERAGAVSAAMHFLQGSFAGDWNRRKGREGAFWRGRYHPTLVQSGQHLSRCLFYIDLNMVRAGACEHPAEWLGGAFREICGERQRYRIVNRERLLWCLGMPGDRSFAAWYRATIEEEVARGRGQRQALWSEALAVGDPEWLDGLFPGGRGPKITLTPLGDTQTVAEGSASYALQAPKREQQEAWRTWNR